MRIMHFVIAFVLATVAKLAMGSEAALFVPEVLSRTASQAQHSGPWTSDREYALGAGLLAAFLLLVLLFTFQRVKQEDHKRKKEMKRRWANFLAVDDLVSKLMEIRKVLEHPALQPQTREALEAALGAYYDARKTRKQLEDSDKSADVRRFLVPLEARVDQALNLAAADIAAAEGSVTPA